MAITAQDVKKLRDATGAGMMDAKKALTEAEGDFDAAVEILRVTGAAKVSSRSDREATNGLVAAAGTTLIQLGAETDFVAKNDEFVALANEIVAAVDAAGVALAALLLQVPLVAALFALTFFLSFIPIVGATVAGAVAVVLALVTHGWVSALIMLGAVVLVMQVEGTFLQPLVMGSAVNLHPLAVLLGITAGAIISGILGALVAIPVLAFGVAFIRALMNRDQVRETSGA